MSKLLIWTLGISLLLLWTLFLIAPEVASEEAAIEQATVQIRITTPVIPNQPAIKQEALPIPSDEYRHPLRPDEYVISEGLGTVIDDNGRLLLLTHDHWSRLSESLGTVAILDSSGRPLAEIELYRFKRLIVYRDGALMRINAENLLPNNLVQPASVSRAIPQAGDRVVIAQRLDNRLQFSEAAIESLAFKDGQPIMRLGVDGPALRYGDSGGGVWFNDQLAGVTWAAVMLKYTSEAEYQATSGGVAALLQG